MKGSESADGSGSTSPVGSDLLRSEVVRQYAHQLLTPLTPTSGYVSMLLSGRAGELSPTQDRWLRATERGLQRLSALIRDLQEVNRLLDPDYVSRAVLSCPGGVVAALHETLGPEAEAHRVQLNLEDRTRGCTIELDEDRFEHACRKALLHLLELAGEGATVSTVLSRSAEGLPGKGAGKLIEATITARPLDPLDGQLDELAAVAEPSERSAPEAVARGLLGLGLVRAILTSIGGSFCMTLGRPAEPSRIADTDEEVERGDPADPDGPGEEATWVEVRLRFPAWETA